MSPLLVEDVLFFLTCTRFLFFKKKKVKLTGMTTTKRRICLSDVDKRVSALKCMTLANEEQKKERTMAETVNQIMPRMTEEYIRGAIIAAKLKGDSSVCLISTKCSGLDDPTIMFYRRFDEHPESVKERIESLIDTNSMCVVVDKDFITNFEVSLCWGHFMYRPMICLSRPCDVVLKTMLASSLALLLFLCVCTFF